MLPTDINNPGELLGVALETERVAAQHYADLATRMSHYGKHICTELFERLTGESREREQQIIDWAELEGIALPEVAETVVWEDPLMPTTYDAEARDPYRSTPYKALAYAAHNADRAFNIYTHIAASTEDVKTEHYAQILANDALNRSRLLQSRRRRAYHKERQGPWQKQLDAALSLTEVAHLHAVGAAIQERLGNLLSTMSQHYEGLQPIVEHCRQVKARCEQQMTDVAAPIDVPPPPYDLDQIGTNLHQDMLLLFAESERAFNFYDIVIGHAFDEEIMLVAQELSESALECMEAIRAVQTEHGVQPAA